MNQQHTTASTSLRYCCFRGQGGHADTLSAGCTREHECRCRPGRHQRRAYRPTSVPAPPQASNRASPPCGPRDAASAEPPRSLVPASRRRCAPTQMRRSLIAAVGPPSLGSAQDPVCVRSGCRVADDHTRCCNRSCGAQCRARWAAKRALYDGRQLGRRYDMGRIRRGRGCGRGGDISAQRRARPPRG